MRPRFAVYVLNWNGGAMTSACIEAVERSRGVEAAVVVIDNASTDGSAEALRGRLGEERVVRLPTNTGYAGGMNAALAHLARQEGTAALLLTQDVVVAPDAIARMLEAMERDPMAGIVGPVVVYREGPERLVGAGGRIRPARLQAPLLRGALGSEPYAVDWVDGCCMLVRRAAAEAVGGFDERYFLYFEETDLCWRLTRAGWTITVAPAAVVGHEKSGVPPRHYFHYMSRNRYLFWAKNFGVRPWRVAATLAGEVLRTVGAVGWAALRPGERSRARDRAVLLARQARGALTGSRDYLLGRLGPMPGPARSRGPASGALPVE